MLYLQDQILKTLAYFGPLPLDKLTHKLQLLGIDTDEDRVKEQIRLLAMRRSLYVDFARTPHGSDVFRLPYAS